MACASVNVSQGCQGSKSRFRDVLQALFGFPGVILEFFVALPLDMQSQGALYLISIRIGWSGGDNSAYIICPGVVNDLLDNVTVIDQPNRFNRSPGSQTDTPSSSSSSSSSASDCAPSAWFSFASLNGMSPFSSSERSSTGAMRDESASCEGARAKHQSQDHSRGMFWRNGETALMSLENRLPARGYHLCKGRSKSETVASAMSDGVGVKVARGS